MGRLEADGFKFREGCRLCKNAELENFAGISFCQKADFRLKPNRSRCADLCGGKLL
jgi:hypothetical protein